MEAFQHDRRARRGPPTQQAISSSGNRRSSRTLSTAIGWGTLDPNDGWTYRGRGLIQVTGKDNYQALADALKAWIASPAGSSESPEVTLYRPVGSGNQRLQTNRAISRRLAGAAQARNRWNSWY